MKKLHITIVLIIMFRVLAAQDTLSNIESFNAYKEFVFNRSGIECNIPEGFKSLEKYRVMIKIRKARDVHVGSLYGPAFMSNDKNCMIFFCAVPHVKRISEEDKQKYRKIELAINRAMGVKSRELPKNNHYPESQITSEILASIGYDNTAANIDTFKVDKYVTFVAGRKVYEMFNADSMYILNLPNADSVYIINKEIEKLRSKKFPYCTSLYITKDGRATFDVKLFFTPKGMKKRDMYIEKLKGNVWY